MTPTASFLPHAYKSASAMHRIPRQLVVFLCSTVCGGVVWAAEPNDFLEMSLEELVDYRLLSISRKEQRVADMAAAAYVVSAEDIRRSGAMSVPEALRMVPGLNVAQVARNRWAVSARGFNDRLAGKLLVQVDGRNIYSPTFSGVLWENQDLVMEDIERIEVIRGPGAALWGTNAMNGVINIVTRSAAASQGALVSTALGSGSQSTVSMRLGGELADGGFYKVYGKRSTTTGSVFMNTDNRGNDSTHQETVGMSLEPQLTKGQLRIQAQAYQGRSGDVWITPSVPAYSDPATPFFRDSFLTSNDHGGSVQARYSWTGVQGVENVLQAFIDHESTGYTGLWGSGTGVTGPLGQPPLIQTIGGEKTDVDIDFQQRQVWGAHDFIWGLNLRHTRDRLFMPTGPFYLAQGLNSRLNYSAFIHDELTLIPEKFKLILGSKFERDGLTGFNVQPNARMLYTPHANEAYWTALSRAVRSPLRGSLATADLMATDAATLNPLTGLNLPAGMVTAMTQISPLPGAKPVAEKVWSLEGGWRKQFTDALSLDTAVYINEYSNLRGARLIGIDPVDVQQALACASSASGYTNTGLGRCYFLMQGYNSNEERARSWGAEFSAEWHALPWWKVKTAYSQLHIKGVRTGDPMGDRSVQSFEKNTPRHQWVLSNHLRLASDLNLQLNLRYTSSTEHFTLSQSSSVVLPAYTGLDARLSWQLNRQTELSVMGRNLLKDRHTELISVIPYTRTYDVQRSVLMQAVFRF